MLRTLLKLILAAPFVLLVAITIVINVRLLLGPPTTSSSTRLLKELRNLKIDIDNGADVRMQRLYPEGYVFMNALYGLAWCNFAQLSDGGANYEEAHAEVQAAWQRVDSPPGRSGFAEELAPEFGSFYKGWNNFLLGKKLTIEPRNKRDAAELAIFQSSCQSIANALNAYTYPVSYYGAAWPADAVVCVASLSLYDELFDNRYDSLIQRWILQVKERRDQHGLVPHKVVAGSGQPEGTARGSSQSLILILLSEIDSEFAREQFLLYKVNFLDTCFGLTGIREFPKGQWGVGDVDSGPLLLGFGAASTIVGATTLSVFGEYQSASRTSTLIEAIGMPIERDDRRYYLLGTLPIADAFIAWGHSLTQDAAVVNVSFTRFHVYSILLSIVLLVIVWVLVKPGRPDSKKALIVDW